LWNGNGFSTFFIRVTLIKIANTRLDRSAALVLSKLNILQLYWHPPNPARNLAGARLGQISDKWPDSGFARADAKIRNKPNQNTDKPASAI